MFGVVGMAGPEPEAQPVPATAGDQSPTAASHGTEETPARAPATLIPRSFRAGQWRVWAIAAAVCCALLLATWGAVVKWRKSELYLLWAPILESKKTILLYTGTISAYLPSDDYANRIRPPGDEVSEARPSGSNASSAAVFAGCAATAAR